MTIGRPLKPDEVGLETFDPPGYIVLRWSDPRELELALKIVAEEMSITLAAEILAAHREMEDMEDDR